MRRLATAGDAAEAENPQFFAAHFPAEEKEGRPAFESGCPAQFVPFGDSPRRGEDEAYRQVGRGVRRYFRCICNVDAFFGSIFKIDVVVAGAVVGDEVEMGALSIASLFTGVESRLSKASLSLIFFEFRFAD